MSLRGIKLTLLTELREHAGRRLALRRRRFMAAGTPITDQSLPA
jgi:hypothetical protein